MDNAPDTPKPGQPPSSIGDQDVERLLNQAETLATEIVDIARVKKEPDAPAASPAGQLGAIEPDPLAAVELAAQDVAEVSRAVEAIAPTLSPALAPAVTEMQPANDALPDAARVVEVQSRGEAPAVSETLDGVAPLPDQRTPRIPDAGLDSVAKEEDQRAFSTETQETGVIEQTPAPPRATDDPHSVLLQTPGDFSRVTFRRLAVGIPNLFMRFMILLDAPFRGVSPSTKQILGIVGAITLLMGVAVMFAPRIGRHNPYVAMEPLPKTVLDGAKKNGKESEHENHATENAGEGNHMP